MIRRYHRWLSILAGIFILWIAATGSIVQFSRMTVPAQRPVAKVVASGTAAPAKPPVRDAAHEFIHFVTDLHSGEAFGITGQLISLAAGLALIFFALSGLWMYIELYRGRMVKVRGGKSVRGGRFFWS